MLIVVFDVLASVCFPDLSRAPKHCAAIVLLPLLQIKRLAMLLVLLCSIDSIA
jgi:hypothetical protein